MYGAQEFQRRIYMPAVDKEWAVTSGAGQVFWEGRELALSLPLLESVEEGKGGDTTGAGLVAIKTGGPFPGEFSIIVETCAVVNGG